MWLGISLVFLTLTFDPLIGGIFLGMLMVDYFVFKNLPSLINQNQIPNNTGRAIGAAVFAFLIFFSVTFLITTIFQGTAFLQGTLDLNAPVQSIMRHGFAAIGLSVEEPVFGGSLLAKYYTFGIVIPFIETRMLIRLFEYLARAFAIPIEVFSLRLGAVMVFLSGLFVWFHMNVKRVDDNIALLMTFVFAIITFELARRTKEMEAATDLHVMNNMVFMMNRIGVG